MPIDILPSCQERFFVWKEDVSQVECWDLQKISGGYDLLKTAIKKAPCARRREGAFLIACVNDICS